MRRGGVRRPGTTRALALVAAAAAAAGAAVLGCGSPGDFDASDRTGGPGATADAKSLSMSPEDTERASRGCMTCHAGIDAPSMHRSRLVKIGCTTCHGGDASAAKPEPSTQ